MQRRTNQTHDIAWGLVLLLTGGLFACLVASQEFRFQLGGKWSVPFVGVAFVIVVYLQPTCQRAIKRWVEYRQDQAEKRWWAERDKRERAAQIRTESLRSGKIPRNH